MSTEREGRARIARVPHDPDIRGRGDGLAATLDAGYPEDFAFGGPWRPDGSTLPEHAGPPRSWVWPGSSRSQHAPDAIGNEIQTHE